MQKFKLIGKPLLGEKYVEGKRKKRKRRKNNAKFSGHYVRPRPHNVRTHALRLHQFVQCLKRFRWLQTRRGQGIEILDSKDMLIGLSAKNIRNPQFA